MELFLEGVLLIKSQNYIEVGNAGEKSTTIQFLWNVRAGYTLLQKVQGETIRIYTEDEAIEAVKQVWIEIYESLNGVTVYCNGYNTDRNYLIAVSNNTTTAVIQFYIVNRLTLEVTER